uniref:Uncharacterized protein n=2 Tax=Hemiselmis andersenii TaxID=464988 RepID=A0A6U4WD10_HEMAN|mmetsp:Transcript_31459/g.76696  ORF Transcript_31459/g.76696 Transcript_31459/m.76696 type:complete len:131 (+) Transcript_31459:160-552(+)
MATLYQGPLEVTITSSNGEASSFSFESLLDVDEEAGEAEDAPITFVNNDIQCDCLLEEGFKTLCISCGEWEWGLDGSDVGSVADHVGMRLQIPAANDQTTATAWVDLEVADGSGEAEEEVLIASLVIDPS